jgi:hypothetical protein
MERHKSQDKQIEALLNALEGNELSSEQVESLDSDFDVTEFINALNIQPGKNKMPVPVLYAHYKTWSGEPKGYQIFYRTIKKIFAIERKSDINFILIKNDLVNFNNETIRKKRAKQHLKKSFQFKKHVEDFINEMEIVESDKWMSLHEIYKWYVKWRYKRKTVKVCKMNLSSLLKFYFKSKIGKSRSFFKLKGEFNMEKIEQLRSEQNEKKQETNKEIQGKIRST